MLVSSSYVGVKNRSTNGGFGPYMPTNSPIAKWCFDLGKLGEDWETMFSIYNDPYTRALYLNKGTPPFRHFKPEWKWTKLSKWDPLRDPDVSKDIEGLGAKVYFHGLEGNVAFVTICRGLTFFTAIEASHFLHVVDVGGETKVGKESRHLSPGFFDRTIIK